MKKAPGHKPGAFFCLAIKGILFLFLKSDHGESAMPVVYGVAGFPPGFKGALHVPGICGAHFLQDGSCQGRTVTGATIENNAGIPGRKHVAVRQLHPGAILPQ
jgi:hypothetical protein